MNHPRTQTPAWLRRLTVMVAGLALVLLGGSTALADHAWGPYHWERESNPLSLKIGNNLGAYGNQFDIALSDWNRSSVLQVSPVPGAGLDKCGAVDGRVEVCNGSYGFRRGGWLGVAQIWTNGDHITKGTVQLNDTFLLGNSTYSTPAWQQMVMCQEIGHIFGLDHQDERFDNPNLDTCMDYTNDPLSNQHPNDHDYEELETIYGHSDGGSGSGSVGGGGDCNPKSPKCSGSIGNAPPFSQASRANGSVYVDKMRNGLTRITHVFWVPRR